jgi:outer membrane autotransporter protein
MCGKNGGISKAAFRFSLMLGVAAGALLAPVSAYASADNIETFTVESYAPILLNSGFSASTQLSPAAALTGSFTIDFTTVANNLTSGIYIGGGALVSSSLQTGATTGFAAEQFNSVIQVRPSGNNATVYFQSLDGSQMAISVVEGTSGGSYSFGSTSLNSYDGTLWEPENTAYLITGGPASTNITTAQTNLASNVGGSVNPVFDGGTLTIDSSTTLSQGFTVTSNGGTIDATGNAVTFSSAITDAPDNSGGALTIANTGNGLNGVVTFSAVNTYTGTTTINSGATLALTGNGSIATSSGVIDNGTFDISGSTSAAQITTLSGNGSVTLGNQTLTLTNADDNFSGVISGSGGLTILSGTEGLSGANSYTGTTTISNEGRLVVSSDHNLGAITNQSYGGIALTNGTLQIATNANFTTGRTITLSNEGDIVVDGGSATLNGQITGNGRLVLESTANGGTVTLAGNNTYTSYTVVESVTLNLTSDANLGAATVSNRANTLYLRNSTVNLADQFDSARTIVLESGLNAINVGSGSATLTGNIEAEEASLTKTGAGTLYVGGQNEVVSGTTTTVAAGTLVFTGQYEGGSVAIGNQATLQIGNGGSLGSFSGYTVNSPLTVTDNGTLAFDETGALGLGTGYGVAVTGTGGVNQIGTGVLSINGTLGYTGTTTITHGSVVVAGNSSLAGALINNSVLDLGTNQLTVAKAITGNGLIDLSVGSETHGYISNNSQTGSTLNNMSLGLAGTVTANETLVLVNNYAGSAPTGLTTIDGSHLFHVIQASAAGQDSQGIGYTAGALLLSDVPTTSAVVPTNNASLAVTNYAGSNPQLQYLSLQVQSLTSQAAINKAGAQLRPEANGGTQAAVFSSTGQALQAITVHNDNIRTAEAGGTGVSAGEAGNGLGLWGQTFGTTADQGTRKGVDGYASNTMGFALGGDAEVLEQTRIGAAIAYAKTHVGDKGTRDGSGEKVDSYLGSLYGTYTGEPWYVDGTLTAGHHDYDSTRLVAIGNAPTEIAKGSFSAFQYGAKVEAGYPVPVDSYKVTPLASLAYTHLGQQGYTETQALGADLAVARLATESLRSGIGAKVATTFDAGDGWLLEPTLRASWQHEFKNQVVEQTSQFVAAGGGAFTTPGVKQAADSAVLGTSLNVAGPDGVSFSVKYDAELKDKYASHTGVLEARINF